MKRFAYFRVQRSGFTLAEMVVFIAIFAASAVFLVGILTTVTRTQVRQAANTEVGDQVDFVARTIQQLVRQSSVVMNDPGIASTTLILRLASSTIGTAKIYADPGNTAIYLQEVNDSTGASTTVPLTSNKVKVNTFSVTRFQNPGGPAIVQVDLTLDYNTTNPQAVVSRSWHSAISRISAASFDSTILPTAGSLNIGQSGSPTWMNAYFSGDVSITSGKLGVGIAPSAQPNVRVKSSGDIGLSTSTYGLLLMAPNGTSCYRLTVTNTGALATSSATCP